MLDVDVVTGATKYLNGPGIDNKLRMQTGSDVNYFLSDHLGSTNGLTNTTGSLTASASYDSFGNATNSAFPTRYQFTGREFDNFSGLQYSRARFYDPNIGRFVSEDPIGFRGGDINLYGYVKNNSVKYRDPLGLLDPIVYQDPRIYPSSFNFKYGCPDAGLGVGAFSDFTGNYSDMRTANTVGADKFFHCMANCQAGRRGSLGSGIAVVLSEGREAYDEYVKGDPASACNADRFANNTGLAGGQSCQPCAQACSQFRPNALTFPVPRPQTDRCQGFGKWGCK